MSLARLGSYHNHPHYCDGAGTVEEYAAAATTAGLVSLGISSHMPTPFASSWNMPAERLAGYRVDVLAAREAWRGRLPLYLGLELDYLAPDMAADGQAYLTEQILPLGLDYAVFSTHFCGHLPDGGAWAIDSTAEQFDLQLHRLYDGDARRLFEDYWGRVAAMARQAAGLGLPTIAGHIDKAKMWNIGGRYIDEAADWYLTAAEAALAEIAAGGLVVELNTAGLTRPHGEAYPGPRLLRRCRELGIPATISADAHRPDQVARHFDEALDLLRAAGYGEVMTLGEGGWEPTPLG